MGRKFSMVSTSCGKETQQNKMLDFVHFAKTKAHFVKEFFTGEGVFEEGGKRIYSGYIFVLFCNPQRGK